MRAFSRFAMVRGRSALGCLMGFSIQQRARDPVGRVIWVPGVRVRKGGVMRTRTSRACRMVSQLPRRPVAE